MKTITLELRSADAEPILRKAAFDAAKFGAFVDHFTRRMAYAPHGPGTFDEKRKEWQASFLAAKRMVEAFGLSHEQTSEEETLGVYIPDKVLKSHVKTVGAFAFRHIDKSVPDPKNAMPSYKSGIHSDACRAAAERVVRRWHVTLDGNIKPAAADRG